MHEGLHDSAPASNARNVDPMKIFLAAMAAQMAEDERRRQPEPQLPLEAAA